MITDPHHGTNHTPTIGSAVLEAYLGTYADKRQRLGRTVVVGRRLSNQRLLLGVAHISSRLPFSCKGAPVCGHGRPKRTAVKDLCWRPTIRSRSIAQFQQTPVEGIIIMVTRQSKLRDEMLDLLDVGLCMAIRLRITWGRHNMSNAPALEKLPEQGAGKLWPPISTQSDRYPHIPEEVA